MTLHIHKVVAALPDTLTPDAIYAVRAGDGFDLYIADSTGTAAHRVNTTTMVLFTDRAIYDAYTAPAGVIAVYAGP